MFFVPADGPRHRIKKLDLACHAGRNCITSPADVRYIWSSGTNRKSPLLASARANCTRVHGADVVEEQRRLRHFHNVVLARRRESRFQRLVYLKFGDMHILRLDPENHCHMAAIDTVFYNFVRIHKAARVTPAMQAGSPIRPVV